MIDPARLQVLGSALRGVAEEMGAALVRAAHSANIKERRDCSTAVFDRRGRMIAQAEHMPVHLGAMPDAVAACLELKPRLGEVMVVNDPYTGGTHLPDITLVSVAGDLGLLVSRAHYADVVGMSRARLLGGMDELHAASERRIAAAIGRLPNGTYRAADVMEGDGISAGDVPIEVAVTVRGKRVTVDFAGTAPQQPGNVNCPIAVTR